MSPFIRSWVRGIDNCLVDKGAYAPWPTDKIAAEICDRFADSINLDAVPDAGMPKEAYLQVGATLKTARERLSAAGYGASASSVLQAKTAAATSLGDRAAEVAASVMNKVASESLIMQGGQHENTPEAAAAHDQLARLDQKNRPQGTYLVGVGNTEMPSGGVVGKEMVHPKAPGATASLSNSLLDHTAKAAEDRMLAIAFGQKQADETPMQDLGGGAPPGAMPGGAPAGGDPAAAAGGVDPGILAKLKMMLQALSAKGGGAPPSPEATVATAGLAQHPQGMDVMAQVLDRSKTAEDADAILQEILQHQGQAGQLATPELIAAIQQLLGGEGGGDPAAAGAAPPGAAPPMAPPGADPEAKSAGMSDLVGKLNPFSKKNKGSTPETNSPPVETTNQPASNEGKVASLMSILKRAADGSLTSVGKNTPESAAKDQQLAELDQKNRSTKEYLVGQGQSKMPNEGQIYEVKKPAPAMNNSVSTDTTPSRETKSAELNDEEAEYLSQLRKTAGLYGSQLPVALSESEKVAHIYAIHGMMPSERPAYLAGLRK